MTATSTSKLHYSQADIDGAFEPVKSLLIRMMNNHTDPARIAQVLEVVVEELNDRHQRRLAHIREYQDRARIAAENRPTLHRILLPDAAQAAPPRPPHPPAPSSPQPPPASS